MKVSPSYGIVYKKKQTTDTADSFLKISPFLSQLVMFSIEDGHTILLLSEGTLLLMLVLQHQIPSNKEVWLQVWCRVVRTSKQGLHKSKELVDSSKWQKVEDERHFSSSTLGEIRQKSERLFQSLEKGLWERNGDNKVLCVHYPRV